MTFKRFYLSCLFGVLAGLACVFVFQNHDPIRTGVLATIFASRVLIGFVIGISGWKIMPLLHGLLVGLVVSIPGLWLAMTHGLFGLNQWMMVALWLVAGMVYGLVIELLTSYVFKARMK